MVLPRISRRLVLGVSLLLLALAAAPTASASLDDCGHDFAMEDGEVIFGGVCVDLSPGTRPQDVVSECWNIVVAIPEGLPFDLVLP